MLKFEENYRKVSYIKNHVDINDFDIEPIVVSNKYYIGKMF